MKLVARILALVLVFIASVVTSAVLLIYFNQHRIIVAILTNIRNQTGVEILAEGSRVEVRNHLIVELERPRVLLGNHEIISLQRLRAVVNFRSISSHGLPLRELDLENAILTAPIDSTSAGSGAMPHPEREMITLSVAGLEDLAQIARRFVITNLEVRDRSGIRLLGDANVLVYRTHAAPGLWNIAFDTLCELPSISGTHVAGRFNLGEGGILQPNEFMQGTLWFWQLPIRRLSIGNVQVDGQSQGHIKFSVGLDAVIEGVAALGLKELTIRSPDLSSPLVLGDYTLEARFSTSSQQMTISNASLVHEGKPMVAAQVSIEKPYEANPKLGIGISDLKIQWKDVLASVRKLRRVPPPVDNLVRQVKSARIEIEKASLDSSLVALQNMRLESIIEKLSVNALISELSFATPPATRLPDVTNASAQIVFAKGTLSLLQGTAKIGNSELRGIEAELDLRKGLERVPYRISAKGDLDLGELRPAAMKVLDSFNVNERDRLLSLTGGAEVDLDASGTLRKDRPTTPEKYRLEIEPRSVMVGFRGAPGPIGLASGTITLRPDAIDLEKVSARSNGGTADFDGELRIGDRGIKTHGLRIDMHQMPIERWLEGVVDPDDFSAAGDVGGKLLVTGDLQSGFLVNGKLTLQKGRVQLGFLRSPLLVHPAILTIRDRTLVVSMPAAELEKSPIDFTITVEDLSHPSIRIDANVQKLDIEVMKFVRLPWLPPAPMHPPTIRISGHVDAREANLENLVMTNAKTDFTYYRGDWRLDNLSAASMGGNLNLNIIGRQKDDWIHMVGSIRNMNAASLFLLSKKITRAPLSGRLDMTGDLWADTDADFFATMAGTAILKLRDGTLDKFTLLSRLLGMIDLRSWLTAKLPDPRVSGIQFRTVTADFKGRDGIFQTDNLLLDGPVIDVVASGTVDLDRSTLDMKIGMIPFNTVNWLLSGIPLVGKNVAGSTKSIIAAYFNARGPITNPHVTPAPITSVTELFKKTLGLPINLIRPNTIK